MPLDALPVELQDVANHFPDDEQFGTKTLLGCLYRWYQKKTKTWFCFSHRCKASWARWRKYPKVLFAIGGDGPWRWEIQGGEEFVCRCGIHTFRQDAGESYLSRVQYYKRWHFSIQWPLIVTFHFYFHEKDVPKWGEPRPDTDGKLFYFYWNHFDNELVYWMLTSIFIGLCWK